MGTPTDAERALMSDIIEDNNPPKDIQDKMNSLTQLLAHAVAKIIAEHAPGGATAKFVVIVATKPTPDHMIIASTSNTSKMTASLMCGSAMTRFADKAQDFSVFDVREH